MKKNVMIILWIMLLVSESNSFSMLCAGPGTLWKPWALLSCTALATGLNTYCIGRNGAYYFNITDDMGMTCGFMPGDIGERLLWHGFIQTGLACLAAKVIRKISNQLRNQVP